MAFDKWFYKQNTLIKFIRLIIPLVGWIMELLIRLSVALRTKSVLHIVVLILFIVLGWGIILEIIDLVYLLLTGKLLLAE